MRLFNQIDLCTDKRYKVVMIGVSVVYITSAYNMQNEFIYAKIQNIFSDL